MILIYNNYIFYNIYIIYNLKYIYIFYKYFIDFTRIQNNKLNINYI